MKHDYTPYSRSLLENLNEAERDKKLQELENILKERVMKCTNVNDFSQELEQVISDLKNVGHDLHSHDYVGPGKELWGWDYMQPENAGYLQIRFEFPHIIKTFWRTKNPQNTFEDSEMT